MKVLPPLLLALAACASPPPLPERAEALRLREARWAADLFGFTLLRLFGPFSPPPFEAGLRQAEAHSRRLEDLDLARPEERPLHDRHLRAGRLHAQEALRLDPDSGEARYWNGALLLHAADAERSYARLKEALAELLAARRLAPRTDSGGPDRMIGRIFQETPGFPFLGSRSKAIDHYLKSLEIAPRFALTRLWLAETYLADGQPGKAREEAARALESDAPADVARRAEALLRKIGPP